MTEEPQDEVHPSPMFGPWSNVEELNSTGAQVGRSTSPSCENCIIEYIYSTWPGCITRSNRGRRAHVEQAASRAWRAV
eukprot:9448195-Pyramimonas_sp.AAC.1